MSCSITGRGWDTRPKTFETVCVRVDDFQRVTAIGVSEL